ncbi:MAG: ribosomal protein S18-alanine N-acetyltransferase [Desulfovibrionaceae bacterium]
MHGADIRLETLGTGDVDEILALESLCFAYHWNADQFRRGLVAGAFHVLGLRLGGELVGYGAYSVVVDEMEVLNLAVHPTLRRRGLGARLLRAMLADCARRGVRTGFLDVKVSNAAAIDLYRKFGFNQIGIRRKYYPDTGEDALLFRLDFPAAGQDG